MTVHELKCWPAFFDAVRDGRKTFEVRKNDRGYQTGDILVLHKWDPAPREPLTPAEMQLKGWKRVPQPIGYLDEDALRAEVTYVLSGMGVEPGYVVMGIKLIPWEDSGGRAREERGRLSDKAREARRPPPPEALVGALQDTVHEDTGRTRAVHVGTREEPSDGG